MKELNRTKVGKFDIKNSITIEGLEREENIEKKVITIQEYFKEKPTIELNEDELKKFLNGILINQNLEDGLYNIYCKHSYIGLATVHSNKLKRDVVII